MDLPVLIMDTTEQLPDPQGGLRRGIAILQLSMLFMGRTDAPAHLGSFSRASALLQRLCMQGRWHEPFAMRCVADETVWAAEAVLIMFLLHAFQPWPKSSVHLSPTYLCCEQQKEELIPSWILTSQCICRWNKNWSIDSQLMKGHLWIELGNLLGRIFFE